MNQESDKTPVEQIYDLLTMIYKQEGKTLSHEYFLEIWKPALSGHTFDNMKAAIVAEAAKGIYYLKPGGVAARLPNLLGHPTAEQAWSMLPKSEESDAWVTGQMMTARSMIEEPLYRGDMIAARKAFLDIYADQVARAELDGDKANMFWSGKHNEKYIAKTIEMVNAGLLDNKRGRKIIHGYTRINGDDPAPLYAQLPEFHGELDIEPLRIEQENPVHTPQPLTEDGHKKAYFNRVPTSTYDLAMKMHENMMNGKIWHGYPNFDTWTNVLNNMVNVGGHDLERLSNVWSWVCNQPFAFRNKLSSPIWFRAYFDEMFETMKSDYQAVGDGV